MAVTVESLKGELANIANPEKARMLSRFFKTGKGQYGEGDVFLGITVPEQRKVAEKYAGLGLEDIQALLSSKIHEHRLTGLLILAARYAKADQEGKKEIAEFYLANANRVNNWDLVDLSAPNILGDYLLDKDKSAIYELAKSDNIWERRIAILSTFAFIRKGSFEHTLKLCELLLGDSHDLIHKAAGWMLREVGKRDLQAEERFLKLHAARMPRTMLRYAIERFDKKKRKAYMRK